MFEFLKQKKDSESLTLCEGCEQAFKKESVSLQRVYELRWYPGDKLNPPSDNVITHYYCEKCEKPYRYEIFVEGAGWLYFNIQLGFVPKLPNSCMTDSERMDEIIPYGFLFMTEEGRSIYNLFPYEEGLKFHEN